MDQSEFLAITCNLFKSRLQGTIGFGFASHWLRNLSETFKPSTKCSGHQRVITFDSHLITALSKTPNPSSYPFDGAIPPFEQVAPVEYR